MMRHLFFVFSLALLLFCFFVEAKQFPDLTPKLVQEKLNEIMKAHATYKQVDATLIKRALKGFIDELDHGKVYFIESDIHEWLEPTDQSVEQMLSDYRHRNFAAFEEIYQTMLKAIERRRELEKKIDLAQLPKHVNVKEFKDLPWAESEQTLLKRLIDLKALQIEAASKLNEELKEKSLQRIEKREVRYEDELMTTDPLLHQHILLTYVLKAFASSLDAHTAYLTPAEANQFMINVQQRLFGIGAQLRDDVNGFSVVKIVEGGPASHSDLKVKDRIIAVNNEPVVGMDIEDAVELIRGEENTTALLTVIREVGEGSEKKEEKLDIPLIRGEVVLKESRYDSSYEPYGDGAIAYLKLYSFYQDSESSSSAVDLAEEFRKLKETHLIRGVVLDLRYNTGGLLSQAINVVGLFITKGIVVSIKDENNEIQHLRDLDAKTIWDGPLIVLVNRGSASASEIVAQTLQDYGRALVVGDDSTYGKGSFQTFTLNTNRKGGVNSLGEYKVTRGKYYTVSGKSPQLKGVISDIVVPGLLSESKIGEKFVDYPLENDSIGESFDDTLEDIPYLQRDKMASLYKFDLQKKLALYTPYLQLLKDNSAARIRNSKGYQHFLSELKKEEEDNDIGDEEEDKSTLFDFQLVETYNIMRDLIFLMVERQPA